MARLSATLGGGLAPWGDMKVLASTAAQAFVRANGGRLYVWFEPRRCCSGGFTFLGASTEAPQRLRPGAPAEFRREPADGFELWMATGAKALPDELHIELRGWRRSRVEAYWNGCGWVAPAEQAAQRA